MGKGNLKYTGPEMDPADKVSVRVETGPVHLKLDRVARTIRIEVSGDAKLYRIRLLLPENAGPASARVGSASVVPATETIRTSRYAVLEKVPGGRALIELRYETR